MATQTADPIDDPEEAKRKLEALFGGSAPAKPTTSPIASRQRTPSGRVFASPRKSTGRAPSDYRMRLERLRMAREPEQITAATDHFLERHQLPDEVDILYKVLQHPSEEVLRNAMGQLSALLMQGRLNGTLLLHDHLNEIEKRAQEEATLSYVEGLRGQLESLKNV